VLGAGHLVSATRGFRGWLGNLRQSRAKLAATESQRRSQIHGTQPCEGVLTKDERAGRAAFFAGCVSAGATIPIVNRY
jgi:hypothetical protein